MWIQQGNKGIGPTALGCQRVSLEEGRSTPLSPTNVIVLEKEQNSTLKTGSDTISFF